MSMNWVRYLQPQRSDAGRALIEQGRRVAYARKELPGDRYGALIDGAGLSARDAGVLVSYARALGPLLDAAPALRLPFRTRTLAALAEQPLHVLKEAAAAGIIKPSMTEAEAKALAPRSARPVSAIIKPSDSWSFGNLRWPRIEGEDGYGYIPGDLYANCLWYYSQDGDTVVDPMAGSGMLQRVWDDRCDWIGREAPMQLSIVLSDLVPRGPYAEDIQQCDLLEVFPVERADYIVIDPPYCEIAAGQYSNQDSDLANMSPTQWCGAMDTIARRCRTAQSDGGLCTVIVPNKREIADGTRVLFPDILRRIWSASGYHLHDVAYASRRVQRRQGRRMAILNNHARRQRVPLSDISEVLTFIAR